MNNRPLPHVLLVALVAVAAAFPATALPSSSHSPWITPVAAETVDDATLGSISGRFFGADMLVGVRIELVSRLATAEGGTANATSSVYIRRNGNGFEVRIGSSTDTQAGSSPAPTGGGAIVIGGDTLHVKGIGQISQIAGNGNRMGNLAAIQIGSLSSDTGTYNGVAGQQSRTGDMTAYVSFEGGGIRLGVGATGADVGQRITTGTYGDGGSITQVGQLAGNGFSASNTMQLQMMTMAMPTLALQQAGIQQALLALTGLPH